MKHLPNLKELVYIAGLLVGFGIAWGSLNSKVNAQEESIKELKPTNERLAKLETKVDFVIRLLQRPR